MPLYDFRCTQCGKVFRDVHVWNVAERDRVLRDAFCGEGFDRHIAHCHGRLELLPSAPAFTVKGFAAANGYSHA